MIAEKVEALLKTTRNAFYIGRGNDYYVAMEASLKLKKFLTFNVKDLLQEN
mgnify:CR=1 FL=1